VQVDLDVNASASLTHGIWSILTRHLTLTIGLPLAGGLTVRQLGGVLAHEFGHFAQGAGMGTTYIVRMISMWFARVVYERDRWDAQLEAWARESDIHFAVNIVLQVARFMVWCVRRILWVLMMIGHFFASVLMRQMEFDADHYEIQTSGGDGFTSTASRLRILGLGAHVTHNKQGEAYHTRRLVDNLPGWIIHETGQIPADVCEKVLKAATEEKTGWLDTHPSDSERVARAVAAKSEGVLTGEGPASFLFADFANLSREVTLTLYRDVMELPEKEIALQPLSKMTAESDAAKRGGEAMEQLFHGMVTAHTLVFIRTPDLDPDFDGRLSTPAVVVIRPTEEELATAKELSEAMERQNEMHGVLALFEAKIAVDAATHKLPSGQLEDARGENRKASERIQAAVAIAQPVLQRSRERLVAALKWLLMQPGTPVETVDEVRQLVHTMAQIEPLVPTIASMRPVITGLSMIFQAHTGGSNDSAFQAAKSRSEKLKLLSEKMLTELRDTPYPFEHAKGKVMLGAYLTDDVAHPDEMFFSLLQADAILERIYGVYGRALGRLALIGMDAETAMNGAPSTVGAENGAPGSTTAG
jgi:hypothetical protein